MKEMNVCGSSILRSMKRESDMDLYTMKMD